MLSGPRIFKLLKFVWHPTYQYSITVYLAAYVFVPSVFGENIPLAEFRMIIAETLAGTWKEYSQMFNEGFCLLLYFPP